MEEKESKSFNPNGRPKLDLDEDRIAELASKGASYAEIAEHLGCSRDTLERRYQALIKKNHSKTKHLLRSKMVEMVLENGSVPMAIWLSKQWLGMKEPKQEIDFTNGVDEITFTDDPNSK